MLETYEKTLKYLLKFSQKYSVSSLPSRTYPELEKLDFEDYEILEKLSVIKFKKYKYHSPENADFLITILLTAFTPFEVHFIILNNFTIPLFTIFKFCKII